MFHVEHLSPPQSLTAHDLADTLTQVVGHVINLSPILAQSTLHQLLRLATQLSRFAPRLGLTAYSTPAQIAERLISPALAAFRWHPPSQPCQALEVGSGSGALGLTLAIAAPPWHCTLLDRRSRATAFIEVLITRLGLQNAAVVCADARTPPHHLPPADLILFRAVASPRRDLEIALPLTRPGSTAVIWTAPSSPTPSHPAWQRSGTVELPAANLRVHAFRRT